ncbi:MAG: SOS response-associated peptidase [Betaproteobacteria bacterium]|nr:SOS response-associated peptidase [Betaproteobacteria bacterium]
MCGRYTITKSRLEAAERALAKLIEYRWPDLPPRYNTSPGTEIPVIRLDPERGADLVRLKWGLLPYWSKESTIRYSTINAMAETVEKKPSYRVPFRKRRCLIPADGWYEWQKLPKGKQKWWLSLKDGADFCFAGLWDRWHRGDDAIESCTIIVTDAAESVRHIHDRMPVILAPRNYEFWLDPGVEEVPALKALLRPAPGASISAHAVANPPRPRDDDASLVKPFAA